MVNLVLNALGGFLECINRIIPAQAVAGRDYDAAVREAGNGFDDCLDGVHVHTTERLNSKPRCAASLGTGQRDAEWLSEDGARYRWASAEGYPSQWWYTRNNSGFFTPTGHGYIAEYRGPFTAIAHDLNWIGWATPAIMAVLNEHFPQESPSGYDCNPGTEDCPLWPDEQAWREHVAPLIAQRIGCDPKRAIAALQTR